MNPKKPDTGYDVMPEPQNGLSVSGVVEAILEVGRHRQAILLKLRAALECGDTENALNCARQLCGLANEEGNRTDTRLN
jgi:hypothetical protein